jgi:hypothetical protein
MLLRDRQTHHSHSRFHSATISGFDRDDHLADHPWDIGESVLFAWLGRELRTPPRGSKRSWLAQLEGRKTDEE